MNIAFNRIESTVGFILGQPMTWAIYIAWLIAWWTVQWLFRIIGRLRGRWNRKSQVAVK